jgi:hypothetical protein
MFQFVGAGDAIETGDDRDLPVVAGEAADDAAKGAPFVQGRRRPGRLYQQRATAAFVQMKAIARGETGQAGGQG